MATTNGDRNMTKTQKTIGGYTFTLTPGTKYSAIAGSNTVGIYERRTDNFNDDAPRFVTQVPTIMTPQAADDLVADFNQMTGPCFNWKLRTPRNSLGTGRVW